MKCVEADRANIRDCAHAVESLRDIGAIADADKAL